MSLLAFIAHFLCLAACLSVFYPATSFSSSFFEPHAFPLLTSFEQRRLKWYTISSVHDLRECVPHMQQLGFLLCESVCVPDLCVSSGSECRCQDGRKRQVILRSLFFEFCEIQTPMRRISLKKKHNKINTRQHFLCCASHPGRMVASFQLGGSRSSLTVQY